MMWISVLLKMYKIVDKNKVNFIHKVMLNLSTAVLCLVMIKKVFVLAGICG